jgi:hypothetical protein
MAFMSKLLPRYFESEWSFASFRITDQRSVASFTEDGTAIVVLSTDGTYYRAEFDPTAPGECRLQITQKLIEFTDT